jgi:hypothetical protein
MRTTASGDAAGSAPKMSAGPPGGIWRTRKRRSEIRKRRAAASRARLPT